MKVPNLNLSKVKIINPKEIKINSNFNTIITNRSKGDILSTYHKTLNKNESEFLYLFFLESKKDFVTQTQVNNKIKILKKTIQKGKVINYDSSGGNNIHGDSYDEDIYNSKKPDNLKSLTTSRSAVFSKIFARGNIMREKSKDNNNITDNSSTINNSKTSRFIYSNKNNQPGSVSGPGRSSSTQRISSVSNKYKRESIDSTTKNQFAKIKSSRTKSFQQIVENLRDNRALSPVMRKIKTDFILNQKVRKELTELYIYIIYNCLET
jgi:hypothetical protein